MVRSIFLVQIILLVNNALYSQSSMFFEKELPSFDTSVNNITVSNYESIVNSFGKKTIEKINTSNPAFYEEPDPYIIFRAHDLNQYIRLVVNGDNNCCNYFEVGYTNKKIKQISKPTNFKNFVTNNEIKLGISVVMLKKLNPAKYKYSKLKNMAVYKILSGNIWESDSSAIIKDYPQDATDKVKKQIKLKYINRYRYVAEYIFIKNRLVMFGFGTTYNIPKRQKFLPFQH